jgi:hypothetical protein
MAEIGIGNTSIHTPTRGVEAPESGVTLKGTESTNPTYKSLSTSKNMLAAVASGIVAKSAVVTTKAGAKPALAEPKSAVASEVDFVRSLDLVVQRIKEDPAYAAKAEALFAQTSPAVLPSGLPAGLSSGLYSAGSGFDINGMNSFSPVELIMLLLQLLDSLRTTDAALNAKLTISAAKAVDRTVAALEKQGHHQLVGALTETVLGTALTIGSVGLKAIGEKKIFQNSTLNGGAMQKSKGETNSLKNTLDGVKPATASGEITELKVKTAGGADKAVDVAPSNKTLAEADRKMIANQVNEGDDAAQAARSKASDANLRSADKYKLGGDALGGMNVAIKGAAGAYFGEKVTGAQAKQKLSELDTQVTSKSSSEAGERNQAENAKTRELIQLVAQIQKDITEGRKSQIQGMSRG